MHAWTWLFLSVAIQGLFLGFLIGTQRRKVPIGSRCYLASFVLLFSVIMLFWVGHWNLFFDETSVLSYIYRPLPLLLGPLIYFYIKSFFEKITRKDLWHGLPFLVILLYCFPSYIQYRSDDNAQEYLWKWDLLHPFINSLNTTSAVLYSIFLVWFIKMKRQSKNRKLNASEFFFLQSIVAFFCIFSFFGMINLWVRLSWVNHPILVDIVLASLISFFIYSIGYLDYNRSSLDHFFRKQLADKYAGSKLQSVETQPILSRLIEYIEEHQPFLIEGYRLSQLSIETEIPPHHISELLNKHYKKSFAEVINGYRIETAKELLSSEEYRHKKIATVGYDVGFSSTTTFYNWFKKITGTSPAIYQKMHRKLN